MRRRSRDLSFIQAFSPVDDIQKKNDMYDCSNDQFTSLFEATFLSAWFTCQYVIIWNKNVCR